MTRFKLVGLLGIVFVAGLLGGGFLVRWWTWAISTYAVPARPLNVPTTAQWGGGPDGGVWADCHAGPDSTLDCHIFADFNGADLEHGRFRLDSSHMRPLFYSSGEIHFGDVRFVREH